MKTIVVGVDGSEGSKAAVRFAAAEAAVRGAALRLVCAWEVPAVAYAGMIAPSFDSRAFEDGARTVVGDAVAELRRARPELDVTGEATEGQAARVLLDAADDAELVVVGTRGHGGFASLLLGSVSSEVAHHARCPVVIVPRAGAAGVAERGARAEAAVAS